MANKSEKTKSVLANTLRELLQEKDFSKITISDISERAGVNRKTFYYHFRSVEALTAWMIENEAYGVITDVNIADVSLDNPIILKNINYILDFLETNRDILKSINHSVGRGAVHKFIYRNLYPTVYQATSELNSSVDDDGFKNFVAEFYTEAIAGVLQNWIEKPILRNRSEITEYIMRLLSEIIPRRSLQ